MSRPPWNVLSARSAGPPRYRIAAAALALAAGVILPPRAAAQISDADAAVIIGEGIGQNLGQAIAAAQQMQHSAAEASREIDAARRAYWQAVRSESNVEQARARFARQLQAKDFLYMWLAIPGGIEAPQYQVFLRMSPVDGGIHAPAWSPFTSWIEHTRVQLGAYGDRFIMPSPAQVAEALEKARPSYQAYLRHRDWAEIDRSGLTWPWDTDARAQALMILRRYTDATTAERAEEAFAELADFFGEERLLAVADRIRTGRRDEMGMLVDPEAIGVPRRWPHNALFQALARRDANTYFRWLLWRHDPHRRKSVAEAAREFERFLWAYGPEAVEAAGQSAMERDVPSFHLVAGQLRHDHPDGRIREAVAFARGVETREEFEERHGRLLAQHDRERLLEASEAVFTRRWDSKLREDNHQQLRERHDGDPYAMLVELAGAGVAAVLDAAAALPGAFALVYDPAAHAAPPPGAANPDEARHAVTPASFAGAADGLLYGLTQAGGVFRMHEDGSGFEVLHSFHEEQRRSPVRNLRLGADGLLYGAIATMWEAMPDGRPGYRHPSGAIFRLGTDGTGFEIVSGMHDHEVSEPYVLLVDEAGTIYGLAGQTRVRYIRTEFNRPVRERHRLLFSLSGDGSDFRILQEFTPFSQIGPLVDGGDGYLYGLVRNWREGQPGARHLVEVFRIQRDHPDPYDEVYEVIHRLTEGLFGTFTRFSDPHLILGSDGRLYGTANGWGYTGNDGIAGGQVFRLNGDGSGYEELHRFEFSTRTTVTPLALVFEGADGMLYSLAREPDRRDAGRRIDGRHYLVRVGRGGGEAEELGAFAVTAVGDVLSEAGAGFLLASFDPNDTEAASIYRLTAAGTQ